MLIIHDFYLASLKNVLILILRLAPSFFFRGIVSFTFPILVGWAV